MTQPTIKEVIEALRIPPSTNFFELMRIALVERIESEGIAPPDGWVLVPSEPTAEMLEAAGREVFKSAMVEWGDAASFAEKTIMDEQAKFYKAMLAAAPKGVS